MKKLLKFTPLLVVLAFAGCNIITGNVLIVIELDKAHPKTHEDFMVWHVNKEDYTDWKDHEDKIQHVVDLGFSVVFDNSAGSNEASGDFYVSKDSTLASADDVRDNAAIVLSGIIVAPGKIRMITWQQSYQYLGNFDTLKKYVMDGEFYLYAVGVGTDLDLIVAKPAIILTVNAEP
jgi:hypothetical protein